VGASLGNFGDTVLPTPVPGIGSALASWSRYSKMMPTRYDCSHDNSGLAVTLANQPDLLPDKEIHIRSPKQSEAVNEKTPSGGASHWGSLKVRDVRGRGTSTALTACRTESK